ncbi:hypothetical protein ASPZODRAFT_134446 [Penicilliopsis zonata CBS 506.65]|uniref:Uncharacterized protein n=1 Tax=Penicilliopsis zonata CBS 506.65 TaxID=1073090 RepID=A0A1L9SD23_9EURO|nr:hypothetical protein ASPZODRAFT_134446 [Penicilliopsis zonata CBS 506.65]OJJ45013.1 hypothetical protein ASPZODRAFT_134446 [Penicilliopsis zonata CBS 506.65]
MLASLLRPKNRRQGYSEQSPFSSPFTARETTPLFRKRREDVTHDELPDPLEPGEEDGEGGDEGEEEEEEEEEEEDGPQEAMPLLPIFSASHLDSLPVYNLIHAIRPLIVARCETPLSWDQLRSPQVSQFLVKPIQQQILTAHFSRATLYALLANCLQFTKEVHLNPGNSGTSQTRAMVSELLAIKLLKEYTTRELIDALSYEFHPLQGQTPPPTNSSQGGPDWGSAQRNKRLPAAARISCLELAIRAQAKRFLAHPVVVQQLEAIWAGTIVFHSTADNLHRSVTSRTRPTYGTAGPNDAFPGRLQASIAADQSPASLRRSVTLYDPRDASLFKLSRLRVPRYRQFLSTLSFAVLLGLFLAVLNGRRQEITSLEVVFWFWSAGFMLDEIVGFNEQGFSLYLMSFWNIFDLGILLLLVCYYCMRLYGAVMPYTRNKMVADRAYDILAANAVLLFPRLFSILDHYRYFSQLLIAFRIMASDLVAVFLLVIIACSGFFVAFLSFGDNSAPGPMAYALFQMLMGFTPTAWTMWDEYNALGKIILTMFLFICHFVVVTILITVLTNSFMAIVQNANQEHQFLFAVNTISMVKSDALFSYVAPTNIFAWIITPLRYLMPFRQFIRLNRTIIKITHLPILFSICLYEKTILDAQVIEPTDLVENRHGLRSQSDRSPTRHHSRFHAFNPNAPRIVREPSVATFQKDRALEEVFRRRPFIDETNRRRVPRKANRQQTSNIVNQWMQDMDAGPANPPDEQDPEEVNRLEALPPRLRFPLRRRFMPTTRDFTETTRSVASNPEEVMSRFDSPSAVPRRMRDFASPERSRQLSRHTDIEGDDELTSGDNEGDDEEDEEREEQEEPEEEESRRVTTSAGKSTPKFYSSRPSTAKLVSRKNSPSRRHRAHHRTTSGATMLYNPIPAESDAEETEDNQSVPIRSGAGEGGPGLATSADQFTTLRRRHDSRTALYSNNPMSVPDLGGFYMPRSPGGENSLSPSTVGERGRMMPAAAAMLFDLGSDLGDNKVLAGGNFPAAVLPASFSTQIGFPTATPGAGRRPPPPPPPAGDVHDQDMLSKLVLARMNNIEEGFREVIREVKDLASRSQSRPGSRRKNEKRRK